MNTKTLNTYEKLWLAKRASHNMALAGPTAFWLASGHREARPLHNVQWRSYDTQGLCMEINLFQRKTRILADIRLGEHNCYLQICQLAVECNQILHVNSDSSDLQYSSHFHGFHDLD